MYTTELYRDSRKIDLSGRLWSALSDRFNLGSDNLLEFAGDLTGIFNEKYIEYLYAPNWLQIFFGGSSSGKSVFLAQRTVRDILAGGRNYLILRNISKSLRDSVFNEIKKVIIFWGVRELFHIRETDMVITCKNGYQVLFKGLDVINQMGL